MAKRTNSSEGLRTHLKKDYIVVNDCLNTVQIDKYFQYAKGMKNDAEMYFTRKDLENSYINYMRFVIFVVQKLPNHSSYNLKKYFKDVIELKKNAKEALEILESIVTELDKQEDIRIAEEKLRAMPDQSESKSFQLRQPGDSALTNVSPVGLPLITPPPYGNTNSSDLSLSLVVPETDAYERPVDFGYGYSDFPEAPHSKMTSDNNNNRTNESGIGTIVSAAARVPEAVADNLVAAFATLRHVPNGRPPQPHKSAATAAIDPPTIPYASPTYNSLLPSAGIPEPTQDNFAGVSVYDLEVLRYIERQWFRFVTPKPVTRSMVLHVGGRARCFFRDDFSVSYEPFLRSLPAELIVSRAATETNRCFFIHLGVAMNVHPFALQTAFRSLAMRRILQKREDDFAAADVLSSVGEFAGFVDANCLCFLWPTEFNSARICVVSGSDARPMFSCFSLKGANPGSLRDVIVHCDGSHFTLLRPILGPADNMSVFQVLPELLTEARAAGLVVMWNEVEARSAVSDSGALRNSTPRGSPQPSLLNTLKSLLSGNLE